MDSNETLRVLNEEEAPEEDAPLGDVFGGPDGPGDEEDDEDDDLEGDEVYDSDNPALIIGEEPDEDTLGIGDALRDDGRGITG